MNRKQEIINLAQRKVSQGVSAEQQYADLNAARDKRKRRRERNLKTLLSGGYKQVLLINMSRNGNWNHRLSGLRRIEVQEAQ